MVCVSFVWLCLNRNIRLETSYERTQLYISSFFFCRPAPIEDKKAVKFRRRDGKKHLVPKCPCGAPREFEFQVLPSLLHLLDVDSHFTPHRTTGEAENCLYPYSSKGMNWGVVAIFSCSASCPLSREEFIVVQDSPEKTTGTKRNQSDVEDTVVVI